MGSTEEMEARLKIMKLQGLEIHPKLFIIGELVNIQQIFVCFEEIRYSFHVVLAAFDALFKLFFVFNRDFPKESEIFYHFIQIFFYSMPSEKKFVKSSAIKHELLQVPH